MKLIAGHMKRWSFTDIVRKISNLLAKTSLINGDYRMARKYINILKRTIYYRELGK